MASKIPVTESYNGDIQLLFDEEDVWKVCELSGCKKDLIEDCIAGMKEGDSECTTCYINLINEVKAEPEYRKKE